MPLPSPPCFQIFLILISFSEFVFLCLPTGTSPSSKFLTDSGTREVLESSPPFAQVHRWSQAPHKSTPRQAGVHLIPNRLNSRYCHLFKLILTRVDFSISSLSIWSISYFVFRYRYFPIGVLPASFLNIGIVKVVYFTLPFSMSSLSNWPISSFVCRYRSCSIWSKLVSFTNTITFPDWSTLVSFVGIVICIILSITGFTADTAIWPNWSITRSIDVIIVCQISSTTPY